MKRFETRTAEARVENTAIFLKLGTNILLFVSWTDRLVPARR